MTDLWITYPAHSRRCSSPCLMFSLHPPFCHKFFFLFCQFNVQINIALGTDSGNATPGVTKYFQNFWKNICLFLLQQSRSCEWVDGLEFTSKYQEWWDHSRLSIRFLFVGLACRSAWFSEFERLVCGGAMCVLSSVCTARCSYSIEKPLNLNACLGKSLNCDRSPWKVLEFLNNMLPK